MNTLEEIKNSIFEKHKQEAINDIVQKLADLAAAAEQHEQSRQDRLAQINAEYDQAFASLENSRSELSNVLSVLSPAPVEVVTEVSEEVTAVEVV
jgi:regulator of PEP synthase PpsR (kinase-PPPase family)